MDDPKEEVRRLIVSMREDSGLSQSQLAKKMGIRKNWIVRWETGIVVPSAAVLLQISEALGRKAYFLDLDVGK